MKEQVISTGRVKSTGQASREVVYTGDGKSRTEHQVLVGGLWTHNPTPDVITPVHSHRGPAERRRSAIRNEPFPLEPFMPALSILALISLPVLYGPKFVLGTLAE